MKIEDKKNAPKTRYTNFLNSPKFVNWRDYDGSSDSSSEEEEKTYYKPIATKKTFVEQAGKNPQNGSANSFVELVTKQDSNEIKR